MQIVVLTSTVLKIIDPLSCFKSLDRTFELQGLNGFMFPSSPFKVPHNYLYRYCRSTVRCASDTCRIHEMRGDDFLNLVNSSPGMAAALRNMCRKRIFKKAVKQFSLQKNRGLSDDDIVAAFHDADISKSGSLNIEEVRLLIHRIEPDFPLSEIQQLMRFVDVDDDGLVNLDEFKTLFRQFQDEKS